MGPRPAGQPHHTYALINGLLVLPYLLILPLDPQAVELPSLTSSCRAGACVSSVTPSAIPAEEVTHVPSRLSHPVCVLVTTQGALAIRPRTMPAPATAPELGGHEVTKAIHVGAVAEVGSQHAVAPVSVSRRIGG